MKRKTQAYIVIFVGIILLLMGINELNFDNLSEGPFSGILGSSFLILAMIVTIRDLNKKEKKT